MANCAVWKWLVVSCWIVSVSAYSARRHDNNYLLHDTHAQQQQAEQQHQQADIQELDGEDGLKTGTGSSQLEINFHALGDFSDATTPNRQPAPETFSFDPHSRLLHEEHKTMRNHFEDEHERQPSYHHKNHHHHKGLRLQDGLHFEGDEQRNLKALKGILEPFPSLVKMPPLTATMLNSDEPTVDRGVRSNNENYEDIDNIYKQDTTQGNYNDGGWNMDDVEDNNRGGLSWLTDDIGESDGQKRSAFHAIKRQRSRKRESQFIPGISVGAMTNLGDFFDNLKNNIDFLEKQELNDEQLQVLDGQHPLNSLKNEMVSSGSSENDSSWHSNGPHGTAAFLHAIRTYRPSHRIRNLISSVPDGYHGSNSFDPNYKWIGLGKRSYY